MIFIDGTIAASYAVADKKIPIHLGAGPGRCSMRREKA